MLGTQFFGSFDLASLAIWLFWGFFAALVYYLQTENMREGYPLETEDGAVAPNQGPFPVPKPKTFRLPHGKGDVVVPSAENEALHRRTDLALVPSGSEGFPLVPTGNPMLDGVGPGAWADRADLPDLTFDGSLRIVPLRDAPDYDVAHQDTDPRGLPVIGADGEQAGLVQDLWVDKSEMMFRYLEVGLPSGPTVLLPMTFSVIKRHGVFVDALLAGQFTLVPTTRHPEQVTMLEEEKITAYYGAGTLYATPERQEPLL